MIKGMSIKLYNKDKVGEDKLGAPIYDESEFVVIDNVLITPTSASEILDGFNLHGKKAVYTLGIPKGDTNDWIDRKVEFFGKVWRTFGDPLEGMGELIPLDWNKKVTVERYE